MRSHMTPIFRPPRTRGRESSEEAGLGGTTRAQGGSNLIARLETRGDGSRRVLSRPHTRLVRQAVVLGVLEPPAGEPDRFGDIIVDRSGLTQ